MWKQLLVNFLFGVFTTIDSDMFDPDTAPRERCEIIQLLKSLLPTQFQPARADADMFDPDAALCEK